MLTRGIIIGKIVDDLSSLKYQIETRNRLGQFDLTKFCEDFFREILNVTYNLNLVNLNSTRSNFPGLDLGDAKKQIAYQITSQKSSAKIVDTLETLNAAQLKQFTSINVFIAGKKQSSYTVKKALCKKANFDTAKNILDIDDLLRDIVTLDIEKLDILYALFSREFRLVKIELEPIDEKGNFESSYFNTLEKKPSSPPKNGIKFLGDPKDRIYPRQLKQLITLYERLASIPRATRELLAIIVDRGEYGPTNTFRNKHTILPKALEKIMRISEDELLTEVNILEHAGVLYVEGDEIGGRPAEFLVIGGSMLNELFLWANEEKISMRNLLNTMDFSILNE